MIKTYNPKKMLPDIINVLERHNCPPILIDEIAKDLKELVLSKPEVYKPNREEHSNDKIEEES